MPEPADQRRDDPDALEGEVVAEVRHLPAPVDHEGMELDRPRPVTVPATVVAATGGFLLGVAAFVLVRVLRRPGAGIRIARKRSRLAAKRRGVEVQGTRSFLVDVHLLKR
jgi:hypothetical protein